MKRIIKYIILASLPLAGLSIPVETVVAQDSKATNTAALQNALRRIARNSNDSSALADAGLAALDLGDTRAAIGFLAKADQIYPRSGRVKAGLAQALLVEQNPFGAIRYFDEAVKNGIPVREIAADRGLAYDLIGRNSDAQRDYELAMRNGGGDDELLLRYAVSLGISGDIEGADAKLNPLLQKSDRDAWRNRAFILAMNGKDKDANAIARQTMQRRMAKAIKPFFDRMPKLTAAQKAAAVHFGHFPASENIGVDVASVRYAASSAVRGGDGADAGLIPLGEPLGEEVKKPRVLAMPDTSARRRPGARRGQEVRRVTQRELRRLERQGVKFRILPKAELPRPDGKENEVRPEPKKPPVQVARTITEKAEPLPAANPVSKPEPATPVIAANNTPEPLTPGFETPIGVGSQSIATSVTEKPVEIAAANVPTAIPAPNPPAIGPSSDTKPQTQPEPQPQPQPQTDPLPEAGPIQVATAAAEARPPTPLISETITRNTDATAANSPGQTVAAVPARTAPERTESKPAELASFDLNSLPSTARRNGSEPVRNAQAAPAQRPLADIIGSISIPDEERKTDVVPVDLDKIAPAQSDDKAEVQQEEKQPAPERKPAEAKHPKRYWVQIATGSNLKALKYDFRQMKRKNAELFGDLAGWTSPWGKTRRMVIGPFDDLSSAKKFDATFRKNGGDSFAWVSKEGTEVNKLP